MIQCHAFPTDKALVSILGLAGFISAADNWIVSPVMPAMAAEFGISISLAGAIFTAYMTPYGVMQPIYGFLGDRWGKVRVLQAIVAGLALGTLGCALASSFVVLCVWRAITGFFAAGIIAVSLALIGDRAPLFDRQSKVGRFMGMVFLGQGLSVGLGGVLANYVSWRVSFALFAGIALIAFWLLRRLPETALHLEKRNFWRETARVVLTPKGRVIFPLALATGFLVLGSYSYLGAFLHEAAGLDFMQVGLIVMCYGFACLATGAQVGRWSQRWGQKSMVVGGGCLASFAILLLACSPRWQTGCIATIGLGVGYMLIQSTLATIAFDVAPETKGLPSALIGLGLFGGGGLGAAFCGWLLPIGDYAMLWTVVAAALLALAFVASRLPFGDHCTQIELG
jgi:predicted MFS family arabinose efflux permease